MTLFNAFYWNYTCPDCGHYNECHEEDHDFNNTMGYTLKDLACSKCEKLHDIEIYCNPKKDLLILVDGKEQY